MNPNETIKNSGISRREFFYITAALAGLAGTEFITQQLRKDPIFKTEFDLDNEKLSFKEATGLAKRFDYIFDLMPERESTPVNYSEMVNWSLEVLPQFEYEGAVDQAIVPEDLGFYAFLDGRSHNHVAGRSNCEAFVTNFRFANPNSGWYEDPYWIPTVIHELVHVQQGQYLCSNEDRVNVENTAQIVTLEVMAGLINGHGKENEKVKQRLTYALVDELRSLAMGTAWAVALREDDSKKYEDLRDKLTDYDPEMKARFERSKRQWADDMESLQWILETYNEVPLTQIVKAVRQDNDVIKGLALPKIQSWSGMWLSPGYPRDFKIDDLTYFVKNTEPVVRAVFK